MCDGRSDKRDSLLLHIKWLAFNNETNYSFHCLTDYLMALQVNSKTVSTLTTRPLSYPQQSTAVFHKARVAATKGADTLSLTTAKKCTNTKDIEIILILNSLLIKIMLH
jgi:hypothetical protein